MGDTLDTQLDGVQPNSPIGNEDDEHLEQPELEVEEDETPKGAEAEGSEDEDGKDGRDLNNIYREFSRKQEKFQRAMQQQFRDTINELTTALRETRPSQPDKPSGNSLDDLSVDQLKNMRGQVPEEQREAFNDYLMERIITDEVGKRTTQLTKNQTFELQRAKANQSAVDRYPQLKDKSSEFRSAVEAELRARGGKDYAQANPAAVLDVANEIAAQTGVRANVGTTVVRPRRQPLQPSATRKGKPVQTKEEETMTDEQARAIAKRLEGATGVKFDIQKIKERHKMYKDNQDLFVK